jgi:tetratricopeptide (TPR) repeat protein
MKEILLIISFIGVVHLGFCQEKTHEDYFNEGLVKYKNEDYKGAIRSFTKAIELKPDFTDAYFQRGCSRDDSGDSKGAIPDFSKTIELDPKYLEAYFYRGHAFMTAGENKKACDDWKKCKSMGDKQCAGLVSENCN